MNRPAQPGPAETQGPIESLQNSHVAAARALLTRKGRTSAAAFLVEGPHPVAEALDAGDFQVREVFVTAAAAGRDDSLLPAAAANGVRVHLVSERVMASLGDTVTPAGVVAVVQTPATDMASKLSGDLQLAVLLARVSDPGNAGTVIRSADAAGADAVIVASGSADVWSGKCVRASAGSVFHVPIITSVTVPAAIDAARAGGARILATAADGEVDLDELIDAGELARATVWLFGSESHGLDDTTRARADRVVRLPVYGRAESLNLASAAAVCLYASARAQRG